MLNFGKSNDKILKCFNEHQQNVAECVDNFSRFFEILFSEKPEKVLLESAKTSIDNCEAEADRELRHVVDLMKESFLPLTRSNLIAIVQSTDDIANKCQSVARQILLEKINIPIEIRHDIVEIVSITKDQLNILYVAIDKLLNDFKSIAKNKKILDDVRIEESHIDNIEAMLHARIFELNISLCEKIYYRDLIESICQISDIIEDISDKIQIMIVEREA